MKKVELADANASLDDIKAMVDELIMLEPQGICVCRETNIKSVSVKNKEMLNGIVILNNPDLSRQLIDSKILAQVNIFATDEKHVLSELLNCERPHLEVLGVGGKLENNQLEISQCPNLKGFALMSVDSPEAVIDLSRCKKLETIEIEGENKIKRIIVPNGFDKSSVKGLDKVEILTAGEAKAKDLLAQMRTKPNTEDTEQQSTKMDKFMALRGLVNSQQNIFDKRMPQTQNQNEAEQRIQQMLIRKRQIAACYA